MQVYEKSYNLLLQYNNVCLSRQWASLYSDRFYF